MTGPAPENITWDSVYNAFLMEKQLWGKDSGRMYAHNIISFHKNEQITPEQALEFGKQFAEMWFNKYQTVVAVHQDREHIHIHMITNSVSYVDGHKLHTKKKDLEDMKLLTNQMCQKRNLSIAKKGQHFDGTPIEDYSIISWNKDKYQALIKQINTALLDCVTAVIYAKSAAICKDEFVDKMAELNWKTVWEESRKHITFINADGKKIRDCNISKNFSVDIDKESLESVFKLNTDQQISPRQYDRFAKQLRENKALKYSLESRIEALLEYINECPVNEPSIKLAQEKVSSLRSDVARLEMTIDTLEKRIKKAKVIDRYNNNVPEEQHTLSGPKFHF